MFPTPALHVLAVLALLACRAETEPTCPAGYAQTADGLCLQQNETSDLTNPSPTPAPTATDGPSADAAGDGGDGILYVSPGGITDACPGDTPAHDIPWVGQKIAGNSWTGQMCCGPAVLASVEAADLGNEDPGDPELMAMIDWIDANLPAWDDNAAFPYQCDPNGTDSSEIVAVAQGRLDLTATTLYTDWCSLKGLLSSDTYAIVHVDSQAYNDTTEMRVGSSHWMVLEYLAGGFAHVIDPGRTLAEDGKKAYTEASTADSFERRGGLAVLIDIAGGCFGDVDGDGFGDGGGCAGVDCDDSNPAVFSGAPEACDDEDSDCDGSLVDGFSDLDADGDPDCDDDDDDDDGYPDVAAGPDADGDGDPDASDCDDGDATVYTGAPESCDGSDENCDGIVDDPAICWVAIYRFSDPATGAVCWNSDVIPPAACAGYAYDIESWIVPASGVPGTFEARQCSLATDHIVTPYDITAGSDYQSLLAAGYDCSLRLGYPYALGAGPSGVSLPFANKCPLYRFSFNTAGGGAHLFSRGADNLAGKTCEPPARAEVLTDFACFASAPAGC
jgi:hypothetical protein